MTGSYRVIVTGSRVWPAPNTVRHALDEAFATAPRRPFVLIHGACRTGADAHAHLWALTAPDATEEPHPADWDQHGKAAGPIRNQQMVAAGADLVLAFLLPDSRGTRHTVQLAETAGIPIRRYEVTQ